MCHHNSTSHLKPPAGALYLAQTAACALCRLDSQMLGLPFSSNSELKGTCHWFPVPLNNFETPFLFSTSLPWGLSQWLFSLPSSPLSPPPLFHTHTHKPCLYVWLATTKQLAKHLLALCRENKTLSLLPLKSSCPHKIHCRPRHQHRKSQERLKRVNKGYFFTPLTTQVTCDCVCLSVEDGFCTRPPLLPAPFPVPL